MSYEVVCAECNETILIEDLGVEVHCPHCQTVLMLSEEDAEQTEPTPAPEAAAEAPAAEPATPSVAEPSSVLEEAGEPAEEDYPSYNFTKSAPAPAAQETPAAEPKPADTPAPAPTPAPAADAPNFNFLGQAAEEEEAPAFSFGGPVAASTAAAIATPAAATAKEAEPAAEIKAEPSYARRNTEVSRIVMMSLISYSIFVTLALLYLLVQFRTAKPHQLESLPDIKPAEKGQFVFYRENATLAPGHSLAIGESQRFGNVRITPLRVTRGELRFQHFQGKPNTSKAPTEPVYKLWLKVENVSDDQTFAPLDVELLSLRRMDPKDIHRMHANNWICTEDDFNSQGGRVLMFNHPATSEYDISGMVARPLKPGEEVETFLPSQEDGLSKLKGDLIWRFQLRKGYNPDTKNGVTTLVEVRFSSDDVSSDS